MHRKTCLYSIFLAGLAIAADPVNLSGIVSNQGGKPVSGAIVTLSGQGLRDTTDTKGAYSITKGDVAVLPSPILPHAEGISINKGKIHFQVAKSAHLKIELFDMSGNLLKRELNQYAPAGDYHFDITPDKFASRMTAIRASIGNNSSTFRCLLTPSGKRVISQTSSTFTSDDSRVLAKLQATLDSLKVAAPGCTTKTVAVSSYSQVINVTVDTLPYFSFFVTSLKGLRKLSGSPLGFGGDFRFGKTGQGAGLLGADSICQCLAESSMKGARFKQWRAFLSVAKGPNGTQVNAIDRIGSGPWYDRMGRLVANDITELKKDRPSGADPEIKNDLPNEEGIGNHQPDPTKGKVDNHLTITGSKTDGTLYSSTSTCEDWTSTSKTGSKPRAGLCWPQEFSMGMKNWISVWDMSGCAPGIDSTDASGAGQNNGLIGSGGGYGGFYCFGLNK